METAPRAKSTRIRLLQRTKPNYNKGGDHQTDQSITPELWLAKENDFVPSSQGQDYQLSRRRDHS